jgi:YebC/PmpR family DNA-binding regulatory protein
MVAARVGGGNPADNLRLRYAIDQARAESMPKDSIERAIKKGTGELGAQALEELTYEGIAPGGVSFILEILTDNRNRTGSELRNLIEKRGGSLGKAGSATWKFDRKGVLELPVELVAEDLLFEAAVEAGADNLVIEGDKYLVTTPPEDLEKVRQALREALAASLPKAQKKPWEGGEEQEEPQIFTRQEIAWIPKHTVPVDGEKARAVLSMVQEFEDHEDVQNMWWDFDIPDEILREDGG